MKLSYKGQFSKEVMPMCEGVQDISVEATPKELVDLSGELGIPLKDLVQAFVNGSKKVQSVK